MTHGRMFKTLMDLGFEEKDAEVYVFLAINGSHGARDIAESLKTNKRRVCRVLEKLQSKDIVCATSAFPAEFSAVAFDKVLDLLIRDALEEANCIQEKKDGILALWNSLKT